MAIRYLIYSTGTTFSGTIVRESATNNPGANEAAYYTDFLIPEIQPLYLWQVNTIVAPSDVIPNSDSNINNYEASIAPAPLPNDSITYGEVTGLTSQKIDVVTGATSQVPVFLADGNLQGSGYTIPQLTGLTTYTFTGSGGTIVTTNGNAINVFSAPPTGTTVAWGSITGTLSSQTDLWNVLTAMTGETANKLDASVFNTYTGTTAPILSSAITGVTNLGSGTTLGNTSGRNITLKSISVLGGLSISGDANNLILSGGSTGGGTWGSITGTLSNQTDLWGVLTGKTDVSLFNLFTGTTAPATYLAITDFNTFSGTTLPANYYNKTEVNNYTGQTLTLINTKVAKVTGATSGNIVTFASGGEVQDSGKDFITTVNTAGVATDTHVPTEKAVRDAINSAIAASIILQGNWNASTNTPDLTVTGITTGFAWYVNVSGTTDLGGIALWEIGDLAVKSASGWIKIANQDVSAVWGNISGDILNQTDLQNQFGTKLDVTGFTYYTGTTVPNTYLTISNFNTFSGTTLPANYYNKTEIDNYTGATATEIGNKLDTSVFDAYTGSTANKDKKIQLVSTGTTDGNTILGIAVDWHSASPNATDIYSWTGGTSTVQVLSGGTYEVQYHVTLKNSTANQTHSVGGYLILNNATTLPITATATMIVGPNASGELSLPPVVLTLSANDKLDLAVFRIGNSGTAETVPGSVYLVLNKLT